jgi:hypothetical protein
MPDLAGLYPAPTHVPEGRTRRYQGQDVPDLRTRCTTCGKVVFADDEIGALRSAASATLRGTPMIAYLGHCGHWHTSRVRRKK